MMTFEIRVLKALAPMLLLVLGTGCQATCEDACRKIIKECEAGIPSYNREQCVADCELVQDEYKAHDYLETQSDAFKAELECIQNASCDELLNPDAENSCYRQAQSLYIF